MGLELLSNFFLWWQNLSLILKQDVPLPSLFRNVRGTFLSMFTLELNKFPIIGNLSNSSSYSQIDFRATFIALAIVCPLLATFGIMLLFKNVFVIFWYFLFLSGLSFIIAGLIAFILPRSSFVNAIQGYKIFGSSIRPELLIFLIGLVIVLCCFVLFLLWIGGIILSRVWKEYRNSKRISTLSRKSRQVTQEESAEESPKSTNSPLESSTKVAVNNFVAHEDTNQNENDLQNDSVKYKDLSEGDTSKIKRTIRRDDSRSVLLDQKAVHSQSMKNVHSKSRSDLRASSRHLLRKDSRSSSISTFHRRNGTSLNTTSGGKEKNSKNESDKEGYASKLQNSSTKVPSEGDPLHKLRTSDNKRSRSTSSIKYRGFYRQASQNAHNPERISVQSRNSSIQNLHNVVEVTQPESSHHSSALNNSEKLATSSSEKRHNSSRRSIKERRKEKYALGDLSHSYDERDSLPSIYSLEELNQNNTFPTSKSNHNQNEHDIESQQHFIPPSRQNSESSISLTSSMHSISQNHSKSKLLRMNSTSDSFVHRESDMNRGLIENATSKPASPPNKTSNEGEASSMNLKRKSRIRRCLSLFSRIFIGNLTPKTLEERRAEALRLNPKFILQCFALSLISFLIGLFLTRILKFEYFGVDKASPLNNLFVDTGWSVAAIVIGVLLIILSIFLFLTGLINLVEFGRSATFALSNLIRVNALKLFFLYLSVLYIPLVSILFSSFVCSNVTCPVGTTHVFKYNTLSLSTLFKSDTSQVCQPCQWHSNNFCPSALSNVICPGGSDYRLSLDPSLSCFTDIASFFWMPSILIGIVFGLGIPLLYFILTREAVKHSKRFDVDIIMKKTLPLEILNPSKALVLELEKEEEMAERELQLKKMNQEKTEEALSRPTTSSGALINRQSRANLLASMEKSKADLFQFLENDKHPIAMKSDDPTALLSPAEIIKEVSQITRKPSLNNLNSQSQLSLQRNSSQFSLHRDPSRTQLYLNREPSRAQIFLQRNSSQSTLLRSASKTLLSAREPKPSEGDASALEDSAETLSMESSEAVKRPSVLLGIMLTILYPSWMRSLFSKEKGEKWHIFTTFSQNPGLSLYFSFAYRWHLFSIFNIFYKLLVVGVSILVSQSPKFSIPLAAVIHLIYLIVVLLTRPYSLLLEDLFAIVVAFLSTANCIFFFIALFVHYDNWSFWVFLSANIIVPILTLILILFSFMRICKLSRPYKKRLKQVEVACADKYDVREGIQNLRAYVKSNLSRYNISFEAENKEDFKYISQYFEAIKKNFKSVDFSLTTVTLQWLLVTFLIIGFCCFIALISTLLGMLYGELNPIYVPSSVKMQETPPCGDYLLSEFLSYGNWASFTENCCCNKATHYDGSLSAETYLEVEMWHCANGNKKERVRRMNNNGEEQSGLNIRSFCSTTFNAGYSLNDCENGIISTSAPISSSESRFELEKLW